MLLRMIGVPYFTSAQLVRTLKVWPLGRIRDPMHQNVYELSAFNLPYSKSFRVQIDSLDGASQGMLVKTNHWLYDSCVYILFSAVFSLLLF